jgi:hypothetical protein
MTMNSERSHRTAVIDVEASGLGPGTYPIEVAWGFADNDQADSFLISPADDWLINGVWTDEAEQLHQISISELISSGKSVHDVAQALNAALAGCRVLTDNPAIDADWLRLLFDAAGMEPAFLLEDFEAALPQVLPPGYYIAAMEEAARRFPISHRAAGDVRYLIGLYQLLNAEKMR